MTPREIGLTAYIEGTAVDIDSACHQVASLGATIIPHLLEGSSLYLRGLPILPGRVWYIDNARARIQRLVGEIATSSPQNGFLVGSLLAQSLQNSDWRIRALAAVLCISEGIPRSTYAEAVVRGLVGDPRDEVRTACAVAVTTVNDVPPQVREASAARVLLIASRLPSMMPELVQRFKLTWEGQDEDKFNIALTYIATFQFVADYH